MSCCPCPVLPCLFFFLGIGAGSHLPSVPAGVTQSMAVRCFALLRQRQQLYRDPLYRKPAAIPANPNVLETVPVDSKRLSSPGTLWGCP